MNIKPYARLLLQVVLVAFIFILTGNHVEANSCRWDGVWQTNKGLMELTQKNNKVFGKYDKDKGSITGTVNGIMLDARYNYGVAPNNKGGTVKFTLMQDCNTIKGAWKWDGETNWQVEQWNGKKIELNQVHKTPQPANSNVSHNSDKVATCNWTGYYKTSKGNVKLTQKGYRVVGLYDNDRCGIKGYIEGQAVEGELACGDINGRFRFIMNPLCDGFRGQEFTSSNQINEWNGTRSDYANVNKIDNRIGTGTLIADQYSRCTWNGYWKTDIGTFLATQEGYKVTAQFKDGSKRRIVAYSEKGSVLKGDIIDYYGKKIENINIFMNPDCQSFNGNRNYGTLQNPPTFQGKRIDTIGSDDVIKKVPDTSNKTITPPVTSTPVATPQLTNQTSCCWTGKWITNPPGEINITQNGNHFTGNYLLDNGKIEGKVAGNKLVGTWADGPSYQAPYDAGQIIYTMAPDCQSFTVDFRGGFDNLNLPWAKSAWSARRAN